MPIPRDTNLARATDRRFQTVAESMHADATEARASIRRLLGWNITLESRNTLREALEIIDTLDNRAVNTMRADARVAAGHGDD